MLELIDDVLRAARAPLAFVKNRNIAEDARPWTAARGLHRREALHRQDGRDVERHRFDKIQRQTLAVRIGPLVEVTVQGTVRIVDDIAVFHPSEAGNCGGVVQTLKQVEDELFAIATANEVYLGTLHLD